MTSYRETFQRQRAGPCHSQNPPFFIAEACVAERLTPRTPDLEIRGSSLARRVVSLDKELYSTLSLRTQVYKWVPAR